MGKTDCKYTARRVFAGARIGHVRWTICAMLFAATTINYMDRQVLGLLKPTLMQSVANHGIGLTEESFGDRRGLLHPLLCDRPARRRALR